MENNGYSPDFTRTDSEMKGYFISLTSCGNGDDAKTRSKKLSASFRILALFTRKNNALFSPVRGSLKPKIPLKNAKSHHRKVLSLGTGNVGAFFGVDDDFVPCFHEERSGHLKPCFDGHHLVAT